MQNKAIEVIRHSLNAASAALELLKPTVAVVGESYCTEECVREVERPSPLLRLLAELTDSRFSLRTLAELSNVTGVPQEFILDELDNNGIEYVTRTRISDGAPLVGLMSRN